MQRDRRFCPKDFVFHKFQKPNGLLAVLKMSSLPMKLDPNKIQ